LGILLLRDWVYDFFESFEPLSGDTLLTAGILLAIMLLPTVVSLCEDAFRAIPSSQRRAARALGLTRAEMIWSVCLPQARHGIVSAYLLALGRALGETVAVFLVVGRQDNNLPASWLSPSHLLQAGQTLTSKLGSSETSIAYGDPLHWSAIMGLGVLLLLLTGGITLARLVTREPKCVNPKISLGLLLFTCALVSLGIAGGLFWTITRRGLPALSTSFFTEQIRLVGADGGIFWNLIGTVILLASAFCFTTPCAVGIALWERVWIRSPKWRHFLRLGLYTMNGLPSIVFGIFGFIVFVKWCGWGKSWLAGGTVLAMSMLPTVTIVLIERIAAVPAKYIVAGCGTGPQRSTNRVVCSPTAVVGRDSSQARFWDLARAAGETAPIMFTATIFAGATFPKADR